MCKTGHLAFLASATYWLHRFQNAELDLGADRTEETIKQDFCIKRLPSEKRRDGRANDREHPVRPICLPAG